MVNYADVLFAICRLLVRCWLYLPLCSSICQKYLSKRQPRGCKCDVINEIHHIYVYLGLYILGKVQSGFIFCISTSFISDILHL